jgi:CARDB
MKKYISLIILNLIVVSSAFAQTDREFDVLGRETRYTFGDSIVVSYQYDAVGNRRTRKVQRVAPDLALQNATLNGVTAANLGEVIPLSVTVANIGARTTGLSSGLRVLLSTDCTASANDSLLYQTTIPVLAASATQPLTGLTLQLPTRIATGNYNILVVADTSNLIAELDETNNIACLPLQINRFYVSCRGTIPRNGLVAYYPFNGNANDESGNANHGTPSGVTATTDRYGNPNSAYSFNGINNFVQIPYNRSLLPNNDQKTYSFWFKFNTTAYNDLLFQNGNADYSDGQFSISVNSQGAVTVLLHSYWGYGGGTNANYMVYTIPNFDKNKQHLLTVTVNNLSVNYYIDGALLSN